VSTLTSAVLSCCADPLDAAFIRARGRLACQHGPACIMSIERMIYADREYNRYCNRHCVGRRACEATHWEWVVREAATVACAPGMRPFEPLCPAPPPSAWRRR
jgi:hypothetical protein